MAAVEKDMADTDDWTLQDVNTVQSTLFDYPDHGNPDFMGGFLAGLVAAGQMVRSSKKYTGNNSTKLFLEGPVIEHGIRLMAYAALAHVQDMTEFNTEVDDL